MLVFDFRLQVPYDTNKALFSFYCSLKQSLKKICKPYLDSLDFIFSDFMGGGNPTSTGNCINVQEKKK